MAAEDMKGLFPRLRKRVAKNAMSSVEVGEDMSSAGSPGGGLTDAQAKAMSEGKPLPKRTPPKKPEIDPGIRSLKEMTDREIRGEPPINRVTKSTSDVVTVPDAFTDTKGITYYQPKGDPFQYEYNATDKSFKAKKDGQDVVTVKPGDPAYEEFLKHAQGGKTRYYGGSAGKSSAKSSEDAPAEDAPAEETPLDAFGLPVDSATPAEDLRPPESPVEASASPDERSSPRSEEVAPSPSPKKGPPDQFEMARRAGAQARAQSPFQPDPNAFDPAIRRAMNLVETGNIPAQYLNQFVGVPRALAQRAVRPIAEDVAETIVRPPAVGKGDSIDKEFAEAMALKPAYDRLETPEDKDLFIRNVQRLEAPSATVDQLRRMYEGDFLGEGAEGSSPVDAPAESAVEESLPAEEPPPASPTPREMAVKAASTALSRDKQLADFRRTATTEQDAQLKEAQDAYRENRLGMGRSIAVAQVKAAMQEAADAEGTDYQVTDADAIYLLENY